MVTKVNKVPFNNNHLCEMMLEEGEELIYEVFPGSSIMFTMHYSPPGVLINTHQPCQTCFYISSFLRILHRFSIAIL